MQQRHWNLQQKQQKPPSTFFACFSKGYLLIFKRFKDWWWKVAVGKCYYKLGLLREAEKQFNSSFRECPMIPTVLHLCKVFSRLDQPLRALEQLQKALESFPGEVSLMLATARIHDALNDSSKANDMYKKVLFFFLKIFHNKKKNVRCYTLTAVMLKQVLALQTLIFTMISQNLHCVISEDSFRFDSLSF